MRGTSGRRHAAVDVGEREARVRVGERDRQPDRITPGRAAVDSDDYIAEHGELLWGDVGAWGSARRAIREPLALTVGSYGGHHNDDVSIWTA